MPGVLVHCTPNIVGVSLCGRPIVVRQGTSYRNRDDGAPTEGRPYNQNASCHCEKL
jgi:hypothetical protein